MILTVFTPTYNRLSTLHRLYKSLCEQNCKDFEWLVVDDGSTDGTEGFISEHIPSAPFSIRYIKQPNGGKHTAYNKALLYAKGDYLFTVDSDDWLPLDSISKIQSIINENRLSFSVNVVGIIALKAYEDNRTIGKEFPTDNLVTSLQDLEKGGNRGERSVVLKISEAKSYPFPVINGEKFVTESVVYDQIALKFNFFVCNEILTICEYQPEGLSSNPKRLMYLNPGGYVWYFVQRAESETRIKNLFKYLILANAFEFIYKGTDRLPSMHRHKILYILTKPFGWLAAMYYRTFIK